MVLKVFVRSWQARIWPIAAAVALVSVVGCRQPDVDVFRVHPSFNNEIFRTSAEQCVESLNERRERAARAMFVGDAATLASALVAAIASATAAFLTKARQRKIAGITGAIGAVLAAASTMLPDATEPLTTRARAEHHYFAAISATIQMPYLLVSTGDVLHRQTIAWALQRLNSCVHQPTAMVGTPPLMGIYAHQPDQPHQMFDPAADPNIQDG